MYATLIAARDALAAVDGVVTSKVGFETGISPADYPLIRVVPSGIRPGPPYAARTIDTLIYFGTPITYAEGLEAIYEGVSTMEADVREVVKALGGRWIETLFNDDRQPEPYKLMAVRCELVEITA